MLQRPPNKASQPYFEEETFDKISSEKPLQRGEYENCTFTNCDLSNADLSHFQFIDCKVNNCNLSTAKLVQTAFRGVQFKDCKMLGLHFQDCNDFLFAASFDSCILNLSSFYKMRLKKTILKNTSLQEVDFTEADLTEAVFDNCDLRKAVFENSILEKADFRTAYHFAIHPLQNKIKKARFSKESLEGLLHSFDIRIS